MLIYLYSTIKMMHGPINIGIRILPTLKVFRCVKNFTKSY